MSGGIDPVEYGPPSWTPATATFSVVAPDEFPHGLRCARCSRLIGLGQPYESVLERVYDNGDTGTLLCCVYCFGNDKGADQ